MESLFAIVLLALSLLAWLGQTIVLLFPTTATRWGLCEAADQVEPTFWADIRGEALWDFLTLWTLAAAAVLLLLAHEAWANFGLVGGGMYLYFAGRGIVVRRVMQGQGIRIGMPDTLKVAYTFLFLWGLAAVITIFIAVAALL